MRRPTYIRPIRITGDIAYVPLTQGLFAIIDAADVPIVEGVAWTATKDSRGVAYAVTHRYRNNGRSTAIRMHRILLDAPAGMDVDHIDMDTLNNRRSNLRICSRSQNLANKNVRSDSSSGVKGVFRHPNGRFRAKIKFEGRQIHIGYFSTPEEAAAAYKTEAVRLFGEFAR